MEPTQAVSLDRLMAELRTARARATQERGPGHHVTEGSLAEVGLLLALEAYVDGLASAGHPVPYRLRDELFMHRRLALLGRARPR